MSEPDTTYSKDYWDLVGGQLAKRKSVRFAAFFLVALYAIAIYAPFLANDRPLVYTGTDYGAYRSAWRVTANVADDLLAKARGGEPAWLAWQAAQTEKGESMEGSAKETWDVNQETAPTSFGEWMALDLRALDLRVGVMERQLADEHHALLDDLVSSAAGVRGAAIRGDATAVESEGAVLLERAGLVRNTLRPARYGDDPDPGRSVALVPSTSFPVIESLGRGEVYFMVLWLLVMSQPVWNRLVNRGLLKGDRNRIRSARRVKFAAVALLPALGVLGWELVHGASESDFQVSSLKEALSSAQAQEDYVLFPPIAYGMAEQHDAEQFRGPTWVASYHLDDEGFFPGEERVDGQGLVLHRTPVEVRIGEGERNAGERHALGTDSLGRDMLARMVWGGRISLSVGIISTVLLVLIGTLMGSLAGYFGGWIDVVISRIIEVFQCFPVFFLILIVVSFVGPSVINIMVAIGVFRWTGVARLVRGEFIRLRGSDFVVASQALGVRSGRIIFRHVLPNALGPVLVAATFAVASGILTESALSFLGFGVKLPIPSWGSLLNESRNPEHWWIQVFPGLAVFVTVIFYNLVGEGVRDALDPRLKEA
jgi:peptide/nickel transport system permease protein